MYSEHKRKVLQITYADFFKNWYIPVALYR